MIPWLAGQAARDFTPTDMKALDGINIEESEEFKTTKYFYKTNFDMEKIKQEESFYVDLPKIYSFASEREKEIMLNRNFKRVNEELFLHIAMHEPHLLRFVLLHQKVDGFALIA